MFPIDATLLPSLATRKALLVVDAQNDFLAEDGALPARMPMDLPERISNLATDFRRSGGEIIWVQSRFESSRPVDEEQIMISDTSSPPPGSAPVPRGRRPRTAVPPAAAGTLLTPEAFLTLGPGNGSSCVRAGTPGVEMHPIVKQAVGPRDHVLTKTFYSAFRVDELIRLLRMRLVTELFICGSSTNVGVMATAVDAASHGYTITIVDDCCGSQSMSQHRTALRQITNTTGCETLTAAKVLGVMKPTPQRGMERQQQQYQDRGAAGGTSPTVRFRRGGNDAVAPSPVSDLQPSLERLSLSGEPAAADEYASETPLVVAPSPSPPPPSSSSQRQSQSQSQPKPALQSMARSGHPPTKKPTDRDTITPQTQIEAAAAVANGHVPPPAVRRSAAGDDKIPDGGRHDSGRSDELVVVAGAADPATWGSTSSSSRSRPKPRSQPKRTPPPPPPSATAAAAVVIAASEVPLRPETNANANANTNIEDNGNRNTNDNVDVNKAEGNNAKGVGNTIITAGNSSSPSSSKASSESLPTEKSPAGINTRRDDDDETTSSDTPSTEESKTSSNTTTMSSTQQRESEPLCEGDTQVIYSLLPSPLSDTIFAQLRSEVNWQRMSHQGGEVPRLVAVQGLVAGDGSKPVYRHPADASPPLHPFTPGVDAVRRAVEGAVGHELNHVLIQLYRDGEDYISEHSDKTLDIARDSFIANVSLGAERTMTLRTKRRPPKGGPDAGSGKDGDEKGGAAGPKAAQDPPKRKVQRAPLPHNSLFKMGLSTNARWLHGVRADKRLEREKSPGELSHGGARISLTFRRIATYLDAAEARIWGQGATAKTRGAARDVVNGQTAQAVAMLKAFGRENQDAAFDWDAHYGAGFDVLHIGDAKRLFLSGDAVVDLRVRALLAEFGVSYARGSFAGAGGEGEGKVGEVSIRFVDNDANRTTVDGQRDIMLYLQRTYGNPNPNAGADEDRVRRRWEKGLAVLDEWRSLSNSPSPSPKEKEEKLKTLLTPWEKHASGAAFIAGPEISLADFAFWPVLSEILSSPCFLSTPDSIQGPEFPNLRAYHDRVRGQEGIARLLGA